LTTITKGGAVSAKLCFGSSSEDLNAIESSPHYPSDQTLFVMPEKVCRGHAADYRAASPVSTNAA